MMGARALVDIFMTEHLGDIGGFQQKLDSLENEGYLSKVNRQVLEAALEAGHAAAHRGHKAEEETVRRWTAIPSRRRPRPHLRHLCGPKRFTDRG